MPRKEFTCDGEKWEVETTGTAAGAGVSGAGYFPKVSRWSVNFRRVSDRKEVHGSIGADDPNKVAVDQLCRELKRAMGQKP